MKRIATRSARACNYHAVVATARQPCGRLRCPSSSPATGSAGQSSRRNVVLANLVQERAVADAQQLGRSLPVAARLPQGTADGVHFGFVTVAAKRQVSGRLQVRGRCSLDNIRLPRIRACGAPVSPVLAFEFGVTHKINPTEREFRQHGPKTSVASPLKTRLLKYMECADLNRLEAVSIDADGQRTMDRLNRDD